MKETAIIVGAGGVLGSALCEVFTAGGFTIAKLHRYRATVESLQFSIACDLQDATSVKSAVASIIEATGSVSVLVCNAGMLVMKPFAELTLDDFESSWRVNVGAALGAIQAVTPHMLAKKSGCILLSGATASLRGSARFAAFATTKFALRGLAQSLAREYQPLGIHVAHVVLDGVLRDSASAVRFQKNADQCIDPLAAAQSYRMLAEQPAAAWTHELDIRPRSEKF
jgi:NADP-dependent 3-hydroxy acid dehydrogenase YdfG